MEAKIDPRSSYPTEGLTEMAHLVIENEKLRRKLKKAHHRRDHYARLYYRVLAELDETKWELSVARGKIRELKSQVTATQQQTGAGTGPNSQHPGPTHTHGSDSHTTSPDSGASLSPGIEPVNPPPFTHQNKAKTLPANLRHPGVENVHKNAWNVDPQRDEPDSRPLDPRNQQIPKPPSEGPTSPSSGTHHLPFPVPHLEKPFSFSQGDQPLSSPFMSTNRKSSAPAPPPAPPTGSYSLSQEIFVTSPPPVPKKPAFQRSMSLSASQAKRPHPGPPLSASAHFRSRTAGYEKGFFSQGDVLSSPEISHTSAFKKPILKRTSQPQMQPPHPQPPPESHPHPHPNPHPPVSRSNSQPDPRSLSHLHQLHPPPQVHPHLSSQPPAHPHPHSPSQPHPQLPSPSHSHPPQSHPPHPHPHQPHPPHPHQLHPPRPHQPQHPHSHLELQFDTSSVSSSDHMSLLSPSSRVSTSSVASSSTTPCGSNAGAQDHLCFENLSGVQLLDLLARISDPECGIIKLEVASSGLGQLQAMKLFCKDLLRNKSIAVLSLPGNGINQDSLRVLLGCVEHCDNIRELTLRNNSIGKECAEIIKAFLAKTNLDSLVLTGNEIEQFGHLLNGGLPNDFTMEYDTTDGSEDSGLVVADSENFAGPNEQSLSQRYKYLHI